MPASNKQNMTRLILWALAWAAALIGSAVVFKGNTLGDWIEAVLYLGAAVFWFWQSQRLLRYRCY
jgi:hypothetical protein